MKKNATKEMIERYLSGTCTVAEKELVEQWYSDYLTRQPEFSVANKEEAIALIWQRLEAAKGQAVPIRKRSYARYAYVAVFLIAVSAAAFYFYHSQTPTIAPGGNRATLTLADGTKVVLDSAQSGIIIGAENIKYNNGDTLDLSPFGGGRGRKSGGPSASGNLIVNRKSSIVNNPMLTLTTPKGGTYQVILEDGTKVWLNAQSTLKYPSRFSGGRREVDIDGEAFFAVNNSGLSPFGGGRGRLPFIVKTRGQEVIVLGTEFNVRAFSDENTIKTTLVNGAVQVSTLNPSTNAFITNQRLNPGQQAIVKNAKIEVTEADIESETGWKDGYFKLAGDLRSIMAQIGRWYNVEVVFEEGAPVNVELGGKLSRNKNLSLILNALTKTDHRIHFKLIEGRLHVMK